MEGPVRRGCPPGASILEAVVGSFGIASRVAALIANGTDAGPDAVFGLPCIPETSSGEMRF